MKPLSTSLLLILSLASTAQTLFRWPVQAMPDYSEVADFYVVNNYVDQNMGTGIQDWNCGSRTYNGHLGIDIDLWPFFWSMMDNNSVAVVAAAPGRVVAVVTNQNNENNCGPSPGGNWNYIAIRHTDSSTSLYGHLRNNSATVSVGDRVAEGQVIAFVGSSGNSSNPHLHFEVNSGTVTNSPGNYTGVIDPFAGGCNSINASTRWQAQKPYNEPAIVRVMTHGSQPRQTGFNGNTDFCRTGEAKNGKAAFAPNDSIYFGIGMRNFYQSAAHSFNLKVFNPDGTTWVDQNQSSAEGAVSRRMYYTFGRRVPANAQSGTYRAFVSFNGTSASYFFTVNCPASQNVAGIFSGEFGFKASSAIVSTAVVPAGSRMLLQAGGRIVLSAGFTAAEGSRVNARIRDCNYVE